MRKRMDPEDVGGVDWDRTAGLDAWPSLLGVRGARSNSRPVGGKNLRRWPQLPRPPRPPGGGCQSQAGPSPSLSAPLPSSSPLSTQLRLVGRSFYKNCVGLNEPLKTPQYDEPCHGIMIPWRAMNCINCAVKGATREGFQSGIGDKVVDHGYVGAPTVAWYLGDRARRCV